MTLFVFGSRIVVMSRAPNTIQTVLDVPFERPRDLLLKTSTEFQQMRRQLWDLLKQDCRFILFADEYHRRAVCSLSARNYTA